MGFLSPDYITRLLHLSKMGSHNKIYPFQKYSEFIFLYTSQKQRCKISAIREESFPNFRQNEVFIITNHKQIFKDVIVLNIVTNDDQKI